MEVRTRSLTVAPTWRYTSRGAENKQGGVFKKSNGTTNYGVVKAGTLAAKLSDGTYGPCAVQALSNAETAATVLEVPDATNFFVGDTCSVIAQSVRGSDTLNLVDNDSAASESAVHLGMVDGRPTLLCDNPDDFDFYVATAEGTDTVPVKHASGLVADTLDFNHAGSPGGQALWIALVEGESARDGFVLATDDSGGDNQDCIAFTEVESGDGINVYNLAAAALSAYVQVYYDEDATAGSTLLANLSTITGGADIVLHTAYGRKVIIRHNASPGTPGVAVNAVCSSGTATFAYISPTTTSVSCPILPSVDQVTPLRFDEDGDGLVADLDDLGLGGAFVDIATGSGELAFRVTDKEGTSDPAVYADPDGATTDERLVFVSPTDTDGSQTTTTGIAVGDTIASSLTVSAVTKTGGTHSVTVGTAVTALAGDALIVPARVQLEGVLDGNVRTSWYDEENTEITSDRPCEIALEGDAIQSKLLGYSALLRDALHGAAPLPSWLGATDASTKCRFDVRSV